MKNKQLNLLAGKKAIVTGSTKGIGEITALELASAGADVAIIGTNKERAEKVANKIKDKYSVNTVAVVADVTKPDQVSKMIDKILDSFSTIDIAFNNAGICIHQTAIDMTYEQWCNVINVNLTGVFLCCQAVAKVMIKHKSGSIINMASMSGSIVNDPQRQCAYNASKAGVIHLTKSLAVEWSQYNIRVNSISPGYIGTPMSSSVREDWQKRWMDLSVIKRMGTPEEIASALLYLSSDNAGFTNGMDLVIDGGYSCL